ncbi:hypothetical protein HMPREF0653_01409 [Prevotella disiens JCM 6334 = ATCC 29426]|uniref:Uncharacterized protein n=1 Tax=Prevotella disiens JCM 6334 = ATCC 29426 TaxID=1235811 RepID=A0ABP2Y7A2_9BACT|nr:hypothetical protein HMPREF0653_01409 [Prevotella disiens JCM 6334 = ATCC 29426]
MVLFRLEDTTFFHYNQNYHDFLPAITSLYRKKVYLCARKIKLYHINKVKEN